MLRRTAFSLTFLCSTFYLLAQPETFTFGEDDQYDMFSMLHLTTEESVYLLGEMGDELALLHFDSSMRFVWQETYSLGFGDFRVHGLRIIEHDNYLYIVGGMEGDGSPYEDRGFLLKTNLDGGIISYHTYPELRTIYDVLPVSGGFILSGTIDPTGSSFYTGLMKVDEVGSEEWLQTIGSSNRSRGDRLFSVDDDRLLLLSLSSAGVSLHQFDLEGNPLWTINKPVEWPQIISPDPDEYLPLAIRQAENGDLWMMVNVRENSSITPRIYQISSVDGGTLYEAAVPFSSSLPKFTDLYLISDGDLLVTGWAQLTSSYGNCAISYRLSPYGLIRWGERYNLGEGWDIMNSTVARADGSLLFAGRSTDQEDTDAVLLWTNEDGRIWEDNIHGQVYYDLDASCTLTPVDVPAPGYSIRATSLVEEEQQATLSDETGSFGLAIKGSVSEIRLFTMTNQAWQPCTEAFTVELPTDTTQAELVFLLQAPQADCPQLSVEISQPDVVKCATSRFWLTVENTYAVAAEAQTLQLSVPPELELGMSSVTVFENGGQLEIDLPALAPFTRVDMYLDFTLSCTTPVGASHRIVATLLKLDCYDDWAEAVFTVDSECTGDEVVFRISTDENIITPVSTSYRIMGDALLIADAQTVILDTANPVTGIVLPADGRTWRLEVDQLPGYPHNPIAEAVVEGCGLGVNGMSAIDYAGAYLYKDKAPWRDEVFPANSFGLKNDIESIVRGGGNYNVINRLDPLDFMLRFVNPLEDTLTTLTFDLDFSSKFVPRRIEVLGGSGRATIAYNWEGVRLTMNNLELAPQATALLKIRAFPDPATPPNQGNLSLLTLRGNVFFGSGNLQRLDMDFFNYYTLYPGLTNEYYDYGNEVLRFGSKNNEYFRGFNIAENGDLYLVGTSSGFGRRGWSKGYVLKTNSSGQGYWQRPISVNEYSPTSLQGVIPLPDGGCLIAGTVNWYDPTVGDPVGEYAFYGRLDADGELLWYEKLRPRGIYNPARTVGVLATPDGGGIVYGNVTYTNSDDFTPFFLKLNAEGGVEWQQNNNSVTTDFRIYNGSMLKNGKAIFTGRKFDGDYDVAIQRLSANGDIDFLRVRQSQHGMSATSIAPYEDGSGYLVGGGSVWQNGPSSYVSTPTFIKFDEFGTLLWEQNPLPPTDLPTTIVNDLISDGSNGFYFCGEITVDSLNSKDMLVGSIPATADTLSITNIGTQNWESATTLRLNENGDLIVIGNNQERPPALDMEALIAFVKVDSFVVKNHEIIPEVQRQILVFPNPASTQITIALSPMPNRPLEFTLLGIGGEKVKSGAIDFAGRAQIVVDNLLPGIYFLQISDRNYPVQKVIITRN